MKRRSPVGNLMVSVCAAGILLYVIARTTSPKIVFLPFLICALAMAGKSVAQIFDKENWAMVFHKLFVAGFLLFWFGFLAVAGYITIRDKQYSMLILLVPFFLIGISLISNKLLGKTDKKEASPFRFANVITGTLVSLALLAGIFLLILGVHRSQLALVFMGVFFLCGGGAFVLGALTIRGTFDKAKLNVLGLYVGIIFALLGVGFTVMLCTLSESTGFWIVIPILMTAAGILQIIKCLKNKK